jgi:hypothetical protein
LELGKNDRYGKREKARSSGYYRRKPLLDIDKELDLD